MLRRIIRISTIGFLLLLARGANGQDLEPRAYSPSPTGTNFVMAGFGTSSGSVLFDPTLPITDVQATLYAPTVGLGRTLGIAGRQALVTAALPYVWGNVEGKVSEQQKAITRSGIADLRVKFAFNLRGSPALTPQEFTKSHHRGVIIGTSLAVVVPTGQYDPGKLINLGANRWAFKPELGISYPYKRWNFDMYAAVWLFTNNPTFYPGTSMRRQDPLPSLQAHVSYTIRPRLWFALDSTWYGGGAAYVNNGPPSGSLSNSRVGATLSLPLRKRQSLKVAYSTGATTRSGSDFSTLAVAWQLVWFDHARSKKP